MKRENKIESTVNDLDNRSGGKCFLERVESILTGGVELPRNVLPGEACQWNDNVRVVEDEPAVKVSKT